MDFKNFWFVSLCFFLILSARMGMNPPLRVAIAANAIVILIDVYKEARGYFHGGTKEKN